jgi:RNA polymerase sigma factor (sigma-70 family)
MGPVPLPSVVRYLRRAVGGPDAAQVLDGELLERFVLRRDGAAFAALVERHGPMVLGVCRRVLQHAQDAEDAFQATFLVLVRRAGAIKRRELLANWLYGVAYRTARRACAGAGRAGTPTALADLAATESDADWGRRELQQVLDEELGKLPDSYRAPLVLCYLQGRTYQEAARELGWPAGTVSGRLARARAALRTRLVRRGLALSAGLSATSLADAACPAAVPTSLMTTTVQTAALVRAGPMTGPAASLAEGVLQAMFLSRLKVAAFVVLALAVAGVGGVGLARHRAAGQSRTATAQAARPGAAGKDGWQPGGDRKVRSEPVRVKGLEFVTVADCVWLEPPHKQPQEISVELRVTNRGSKDRVLDRWDGIYPLLKRAGRDVKAQMVQAVVLPSEPIRLAPGQSYTFHRSGRLEWVPADAGRRLQLTLYGGTPSTFTTTDALRPGKYALTLNYRSVHQKPTDPGGWDVSAAPVTVVVVESWAAVSFGDGSISLGYVHGTVPQKQIRQMSAGFRVKADGSKQYVEPYGPDLAVLERENRGGASNVFLVRGKDLTEAVKATREVLAASRPADTPAVANQPSKEDRLWVVAFFGVAGSSPPAWRVRSVDVFGGMTVRISYAKRQSETNDEHQYFIWVPFGQREAGTYTLELFDADTGEVTLTRRCMVPDQGPAR